VDQADLPLFAYAELVVGDALEGQPAARDVLNGAGGRPGHLDAGLGLPGVKAGLPTDSEC
jgi:hypothetical protein